MCLFCVWILEFVHQFWPFLCCAGKWLVALAFLETGFLLVPLLLWTTVAVVVLQAGELLIHIDVCIAITVFKNTQMSQHTVTCPGRELETSSSFLPSIIPQCLFLFWQ